jgi:NAD(P)H dehydrogenase (quinone)
LTGPEALSYREIAAAFARVLGRPVEYADVPLEDVRERLRAAGLPAWNADEVARLYGVMATGALGRTTGTVKALLRRAPVPLETWLAEHVAEFGGPEQPRG